MPVQPTYWTRHRQVIAMIVVALLIVVGLLWLMMTP